VAQGTVYYHDRYFTFLGGGRKKKKKEIAISRYDFTLTKAESSRDR